MYLVEAFYSLQGEGKFAGTPSIFLRFGGCNLTCRGFSANGCDSNYAVVKNSEWQKIESFNELKNKIDALDAPQNADIVLTGGEPSLFLQTDILKELVEFYSNKRICVETNATVNIDFVKHSYLKNLTFAMSVKLSNSGEEFSKRVNKGAILAIANNASAFFKFVASNSNDENEIKEIANISPHTEIYCMPLGATMNELNKNAKYVFEMCIKNGWNYSDRLHIRIYNDKKGV